MCVPALCRKLEATSEQEQLEMGYRDFLQSPLQPLQDNLESQTYETFERDDTKYTTYEQAVYRCLLDRVPQVHGWVRGWVGGRAGGRPAASRLTLAVVGGSRYSAGVFTEDEMR
jgi:hypothetical protein